MRTLLSQLHILCDRSDKTLCSPGRSGFESTGYAAFLPIARTARRVSARNVYPKRDSQGWPDENMENVNAFFFVHLSSEDSESVSGDCEVPPRAAEKYTPDFEALKM